MPPKGKTPLTPEQVGHLRAWIEQGAKWPKDAGTIAATVQSDHWAFQPIKRPATPAVIVEPNPTPGPPAFAGTKAGEEREVAGVKLCWCPPGKFTMGSPPTEPERRHRLLRIADLIRRELAALGFSVIDGNSPVVAVVIPDEIMLFQMARELLEEGIYVNGVARPAATQNLIRISCTAAHTEAHAWRLVEVMERLAKRLNLELEKPAKAARLAL